MKKGLKLFGGVVVLIALYLALWPIPIDPVKWDAPTSEGYVGDFAPNTDLAKLELLDIGDVHGPEDVVMSPDGNLFVTSQEGRIIRIEQSGDHSVFADTGGVPLGMEMDASGALIIADAHKGLISVSSEGRVQVLTDTVDGTPILYADDLDIAPDGVIYFSDASTKFGAKAAGSTMAGSLLEIMEHGRTGRLLAYDPADNSTRTIKDGFSFSNGVAIGPKGQSVLMNETGRYRILRVWVDGPRKGEMDVIADNLPGFPDNINRGPDGTYFVGLVSQRAAFLDENSAKPFVRKIAQRLPKALQPKAVDYGFIFQMTAEGKVLKTWQDPTGSYPLTTGAITPGDGYMYISSLGAKKLGRRPFP